MKVEADIHNKLSTRLGSKMKPTPDDLFFALGDGTMLTPKEKFKKVSGTIWKCVLEIPPGKPGDGVEVYAMVRLPDEPSYCIGKLKVPCHPTRRHKVALVPVDGTTEVHVATGCA